MVRVGSVLLRGMIGAIALLVAGNSAFASTGCTAVAAGALNIPFLGGNNNPAVDRAIAGVVFDAGDAITLTVPTGDAPGLSGGQTLSVAFPGGASSSVTGPGDRRGLVLTITAAGTEVSATTHLGIYSADGPGTIIVTCMTQAAQIANQANKIVKMMQGAQLGAQASGAAISGALGAAVNEAFDDSCGAFTPQQDGMRININGLSDRDPACFDDNNRSSMSSRYAAEPFEADAYAKKPRSRASDAFAAFDKKSNAKRWSQEWRVWIDVRGTHWDASGSASDFRGDQVIVLAGLTRKFSKDLIAGVFAGYEGFKFTSQSLSGRLRGDGPTVGSYLGWRIVNGVRFDAGVAYSVIGYDVAANQGQALAVSGSLSGKRWFATLGLTGDYLWNAYTFEPSARIYWLNEREGAFTDTLGNLNASRSFTTGRASFGEKLIFPATVALNGTLAASPYVGFYGDYYFTADDSTAVLAQNGFTSITLQGWSGRAVAGITAKTTNGVQMLLGGEYGGIGSNIGVWTYRARLGVPF